MKKKLKIHVLCGTSIVLTQMGMSESYFFYQKWNNGKLCAVAPKAFLLYTVSCIIQVAGLRSQHNCVLAISHWNMLIEMYLNRSMLHLLYDWLALWVGNMNQILGCDWLPKQARWSYVACSWLAGVSHKKNFPESHIINPLLTKLVLSRWLDIGLVLVHKHAKKNNLANVQPSWPHTWSITHIYTTMHGKTDLECQGRRQCYQCSVLLKPWKLLDQQHITSCLSQLYDGLKQEKCGVKLDYR